jgi:hypothetical protein
MFRDLKPHDFLLFREKSRLSRIHEIAELKFEKRTGKFSALSVSISVALPIVDLLGRIVPRSSFSFLQF